MNQPVNTTLQPYGAWYTSPGGMLIERADHSNAAARLAELRANPAAEPAYSHARIVFILGMIGFMHVPITVFHFLIKGVAMGFDRVDTWSTLAILPIAAIFFVLAALAHFRPPQRAPLSMFKAFLRGAIGIMRGTAYRMLLQSDRDDSRLRPPPPCMAVNPLEGEPLAFKEQGDFERYWINAFGGGWHPYKTTSFRKVRMAELAPDLVVIEAEVRVACRSLVAHLLAFAPFVIGTMLTGVGALVIVLLGIGGVAADETLLVALLVALAPAALGILVAVLMTIKSLIPIARRVFTVRKLLVRVNGQWRIFNGELQGSEEADASWVLETTTKAADAG